MEAHFTWPQSNKLHVFGKNAKSSVLSKYQLKVYFLINRVHPLPLASVLCWTSTIAEAGVEEEAEGSPRAVLVYVLCPGLISHKGSMALSPCLFLSVSILGVFLSVFFTIIISFLTSIVCAGFSSNFNKSIYHRKPSAYLHVAIRVVTSETENQPQTLLGNASALNTMP